jgi:hypothetical protein
MVAGLVAQLGSIYRHTEYPPTLLFLRREWSFVGILLMSELEEFEVKDIIEDDEKLKEFFEKKVSNSVFL